MSQTVKISFVGDVFLSNLPYTKGFGLGVRLLNHGNGLINYQTKNKLNECDILFGNLESPLVTNDDSVRNGCFAGSVKSIELLNDFGFDVMSISNNHILEQGSEGLYSTIEALKTGNIKYVGLFNNYKSNIEIIDIKGIRFGFAGFNAIKDIANPSLHADLTYDNVKATIDEMRMLNIDFKLLSFHWGNEYINIPSFEQIKLAHSFIDYGADVIIGHHPHVVQPVERYKDGVIIYSLGNFIFDSLFSKEFKTGMIVDIKISKGSKIEYSVSEVQLNNLKMNTVHESENFTKKVEFYNNKMTGLLLQNEESYNKYYVKTLKINHSYQRIMMKIDIVKLLLFSKNRRKVFKNCINTLYAKIKHSKKSNY